MTRKISALLVVVAATAVFAGTASARKADPNVAVNPSPAYVGNNLVFSGCGYAAGSSVSVVINSPFAISFSGAATDSGGCFSTSGWGYTALMAGSYTVNVWQSTDHHNPSGSATFTVS